MLVMFSGVKLSIRSFNLFLCMASQLSPNQNLGREFFIIRAASSVGTHPDVYNIS